MNIAESILNVNLDNLLNKLLFEEVPVLFNNSWEMYREWKLKLINAINVDLSEIVIIGSAAIGYSLDPQNPLRPFSEESDIDIAIISDYYFSEAWHFLRNVDLTLDSLLPSQKAAIIEHQKRYVYWGCIASDRILPILPFGRIWQEARAILSNTEPTLGRDINFRIYKDFRALRGYQKQGLSKIKSVLIEQKGGSCAKLS